MAPSPAAYQAFLFDMDGTLITSVAAAERVWTRWARRHGLDAETFVPTIHGVRTIDTIRRQNLLNIDLDAEIAWVERGEIEDVDGVAPIPGAIDFVRRLPPDRWAVVTSASPALVQARLKAAGLTPPAVLVTADDVERGKPDPAGYLAAAAALGFAATECLVFEDADAGIQAGDAAGAEVVVVTATHRGRSWPGRLTLNDYGEARLSILPDGRLAFGL